MSEAASGSDLTTETVAAAVGDDAPLGTPSQVFPYAVSTEALAMGWARQQDAPEGALVVADLELSARGRRGAVWTSVAGRSLAFSVVLRPALPVEGEGLLWLLASLAAAEGIGEASGLPTRVKWPNDVLVAGRRLATVAVDAQLGPGRIEAAVLTVRVNVGLDTEDFPADLRETATSLALQGPPPARADVVAAVLVRLSERYGAPVAELLEAYRGRCDTIGNSVRALLMPSGEATGRAVDVDERGGLVLDTPGGSGVLGVDAVKRLEVG